jgi:hypothetical protein
MKRGYGKICNRTVPNEAAKFFTEMKLNPAFNVSEEKEDNGDKRL